MIKLRIVKAPKPHSVKKVVSAPLSSEIICVSGIFTTYLRRNNLKVWSCLNMK